MNDFSPYYSVFSDEENTKQDNNFDFNFYQDEH